MDENCPLTGNNFRGRTDEWMLVPAKNSGANGRKNVNERQYQLLFRGRTDEQKSWQDAYGLMKWMKTCL